MQNKKLIPYVELIARPRRDITPTRSSPEPSPGIPSPNSSPRKKRRIKDDFLEDVLMNPTEKNASRPRRVSALSKSRTRNQASSASTSSLTRPPPDTDVESSVPTLPTSNYMTFEVLQEDKDIVLQGETHADDDDGNTDDVPVRLLEEFFIYDINSMEAVPFGNLLEIPHSKCAFSASGLVKPWIEEDTDDSEDTESEDDRGRVSVEPQCDRLSLSRILELSVHSPSNKKGKLDEKIYVRTEFAWYILGSPCRRYIHLFRPFWLQHRILHLLVTASTEQTRLTLQEFKDNIRHLDEAEDNILTTRSILGRKLNQGDAETPVVLDYIRSTLNELHHQKVIQISRVAAIREILGPVQYQFETDISPQNSRPHAKRRRDSSFSEGDVERLVPVKHKNKVKKSMPTRKTFLTPIVNCVAKDLFKGSLEVAEIDHYGEPHDIVSTKRRRHKAHHTNPVEIIWGARLVEDEEIYASVIVDGVTYQVGDVVMVEPDGEDQTKTSGASQTVNKYGNRWWFCQIRYFHKEERGDRFVKMFHGQWFVHGCKTILQETSHSKALYLLKKGCDSNPISSIFQKCNLTILRHDDDEVADDGNRDANDFHCGLMYDDDVTSFEDLPPEALSVDENGDYALCYSCALKEESNILKDVRFSEEEDEVVVYGDTYHCHDFVYIHPSAGQLLLIGQVLKIKKHKERINVQVCLLERYDDYVQEQQKMDPSGLDEDLTFDERRLFYTEDIKVVPAHELERRCHVRHLTDLEKIEEWVEHDDHFYLNQVGSKHELRQMKKRDFGYCADCRADDERVRCRRERYLTSNSKLIGMELFSGAGGLGIGMDLSEFVETKYAVEYEPSAAKTYQRNHPDALVYCQDSSILLKHAVAVMNNEHPEPLLSKDGQTLCPPMPKRTDQIDFIFGGPPCQSFSKANHSKHHDDIRSTMPCNMMSYVEHYQPKYFLLENVAGFLEHAVHSMLNTSSGNEVHCTIKFGMVKFVTRALIALGYQVRYRLLQGGQYGVPQSRSRVIFWGAKRGLVLPDFPIPTYAFPRGPTRVTLPTEGKLEPITRSKNPNEYHHFAPLAAITVDDATSDLIPFEWINPHLLIPARPQDRLEVKRRRDVLGIRQFDAERSVGETDFKKLPGFPQGVVYAKRPQNRYQKWLRRGMEENTIDSSEMVTGHYTSRWKAKIVEATANVPLKALADHRDLDDIFLPDRAKLKKETNALVLYGRLDPSGYFRCAVTTLSPVVKNQWPLHPSQKRVISVREAARAQGFPDNYIFESVNSEAGKKVRDQLRQIGNAVSVPFALALGKELGKALVQEWEKREREGSVAL